MQLRHFFSADKNVDVTGCGIDVEQFTAFEVGEVLAVGRPGELGGRRSDG
jgi:hypothetical protein